MFKCFEVDGKDNFKYPAIVPTEADFFVLRYFNIATRLLFAKALNILTKSLSVAISFAMFLLLLFNSIIVELLSNSCKLENRK